MQIQFFAKAGKVSPMLMFYGVLLFEVLAIFCRDTLDGDWGIRELRSRHFRSLLRVRQIFSKQRKVFRFGLW